MPESRAALYLQKELVKVRGLIWELKIVINSIIAAYTKTHEIMQGFISETCIAPNSHGQKFAPIWQRQKR